MKETRAIQAQYAVATVMADGVVHQYIIFIQARRVDEDTGQREPITPVEVAVSESEQRKMRAVVWNIVEENDLFAVPSTQHLRILLAGDTTDRPVTMKAIEEALAEKGITAEKITGDLESEIYQHEYADITQCLLPQT